MTDTAFEKVISAASQGELALLKSFLEGNGFKEGPDFYFSDEYLSQYGAAIPAVLMVRKNLADKVREILKTGS